MQPKRNHYWWVRVRREIAPLLEEPDPDYDALALRFQVTARTVRNWHRLVQERGPDALIHIHDGRPEGSTFRAAARLAVGKLWSWQRYAGPPILQQAWADLVAGYRNPPVYQD